MGDVIAFPTPAGPPANDTGEVWRGCWACGQLLFDDEPDLCTDCNHSLNAPAVAPVGKQHRLAWHLRHITPDTLRGMCDAITETGVTRAEEGAQAWAADHLDLTERASFIGAVRGRAQLEYATRCAADVQQHGQTMGWNLPR